MLRRLFKRCRKNESNEHKAVPEIEAYQPVEGYYCKPCNGLFDNMAAAGVPVEDESELIHNHHRNYIALRDAAKSGCRICIVILGDYQLQIGKAERDFRTPIRYVVNTGMTDEGLEWRFVIEKNPKALKDRTLSPEEDSIIVVFRCEPLVCQILPYGNEQTSDLMSSKPLPINTNSEASLLIARNWLSDCIENHPTCQNLSKTSWFPTRVLDLGTGKDVSNIKLYERSQGQPNERYMALSYQWGSSEKYSLVLKRENIAALRKSIDINTLPKVIQEAIHLTKRFDIRYLWIDRFCIIQNDDEDWTRESATMQQVYACSVMSIAASDADTPQKGCFFTRDPLLVQPWKTSIPVRRGVYIDTNERGVSINVRHGLKESKQHIIIPGMGTYGNFGGSRPYGSWRGVLQQSSLYSRGWVLQESILAPRVLHCSQRQLYWECPHTVCAETFPHGMPKNRRVFDDFSDLRRELAVPSSDSPIFKGRVTEDEDQERESSLEDVKPILGHSQWLDLVRMYTNCHLSFSKDKLIAISGVASAVAPALGKYVAGMWEEHLVFDLLWSVENPISPALVDARPARPKCGYIAPSWSWASVERPVDFHSNPLARGNLDKGLGFTSGIKVISASVTSNIPGGYGQVSDGTLKLEAGLGLVEIGICKEKDVTGKTYETFLIASINGTKFENFQEVGGTTNQKSHAIFDDPDEGWVAALGLGIYCVPILVKNFMQVWDVNGILITPMDRSRRAYVRIGYFYASGFWTSGVEAFEGLKKRQITLK